MRTLNLCFEQKYEKYQNFISENIHFLVVKFSLYWNRLVFVMLLASPKRDKRKLLEYWVDVLANRSLCVSHRSYCRFLLCAGSYRFPI